MLRKNSASMCTVVRDNFVSERAGADSRTFDCSHYERPQYQHLKSPMQDQTFNSPIHHAKTRVIAEYLVELQLQQLLMLFAQFSIP
jgi:hypothetical protein